MKRRWLVVLVVVLAAAAVAAVLLARAKLAQPLPSPQELTRTDEQGTVAVAVVFMNPTDPKTYPASELVFGISLDTHAGDLSTYDPSAHAVLRNDRGAVVTKGFVWRTDTEGAHHRSGELRLPNRGPGGRLWDRNTKMIRLEIRDLRETPSRMFEWRFK